MFERLRRRSGSAAFGCAFVIAILAGVFASAAASAVVAGPERVGATGAPGPPAGRPPADRPGGTRRGIVQALSAKAIVLKELDGTTLSVSVYAKTRVFVDGKPASLREVKPGFAAIAKGEAGKPARELRTFDLSGQHGPGGGQHGPGGAVVKSVSGTAIVLNGPEGGTVTVLIDTKTRVFIDGKPASLSEVEPGFIVVTSHKAFKRGKPAKELRFLRPE